MRRALLRTSLAALVVGGAWLTAFQSVEGKPIKKSGRPASLPVALQAGGTEKIPAPESADATFRLMGAATCASMSCHNVAGARGAFRSEYSTWAGHDAHARAFQVLYDERSQRIARNLYGPKANAWEQQVCLNCHSSKHAESVVDAASGRFSLADGVGCESCHGPASGYLREHYGAGFKNLTAAKKEETYGLWQTKDLVARAKICADCHIGNPQKGMDVNHDLIAAGHPRLAFEFAGYQHMYARHWSYHGTADHPGDKDRHPDFEARIWAIGQVVAAQKAIEQTQLRAANANKDPKHPWPEFAEFGCFACHKDLGVIDTGKTSTERYEAKYKGRIQSVLPWATWYLPLTQKFAEISKVDLNKPGTSIEELRRKVEKSGTPPAEVEAHCKKVAAVLDGWLADLNSRPTLTRDEIAELMLQLIPTGENAALKLDWDQTAQYYLALAALNGGLTDLDREHPADVVKKDIRAIGLRLKNAFQPGFDSPRRFNPAAKPLLSEQFQAVRQHLKR